MVVRQFTFNPFQTNGYVCHSEGKGVLIDAPSSNSSEHEEIERYIQQEGIRIMHLLLTHAHIDHIFGCSHFEQRFGLPFRLHRSDVPLLQNAVQQATMFGVALDPPSVPTQFLEEGDVIAFGDVELEVLHTPGHSPGSVTFFDPESRAAFSGDVLFSGSIGRTDLWQGSLPVLMQAIFQKLVPLGDDVRIHSGHGPDTTVGAERRDNPFLTSGFGAAG